jgi:hypothetical protein
MDMGSHSGLSAADTAAIRDEVERLADRKPRRDPQFPGCLLAFLGMVVLTLTPALGSWMDIPGGVARALFILAVASLFGGAIVALFGGSLQVRTARRDSQAAVGPIRALGDGQGDRQEAVCAAVRLLSSAVVAPGPGATFTYRPDEMARRLGPGGLALVRAVEEYLLANDRRIGPVFTTPEESSPE